MHDAAARRSWPVQRGFDRYYGCMEGFTNFFNPNRLVVDNSPLEIDQYPRRLLPDGRPDRSRDRDAQGLTGARSEKTVFPVLRAPRRAWPARRQTIGHRALSRSLRRWLGRRAGAALPASARHGPVSRGHAARAAQRRARPRRRRAGRTCPASSRSCSRGTRRCTRRWSTTSIRTSVACWPRSRRSANWTTPSSSSPPTTARTAEGGAVGTRSYFSQFQGLVTRADWQRDVPRDPELIGGPRTSIHYPRGWGMASNTPFRLYKTPHVRGWGAGAVHPVLARRPRCARDRGLSTST